jgi:hypothetical protein
VFAWTALTTRSHGTLSKNFRMSRSITQSVSQHRRRQAATASSAERFGRYPYESGWKSRSALSSSTPATTVCAIRSATVGTPSIRVPIPCAFATSTARTGGGKYVPDDIRFQTLYRLPFRSFSKSATDSPSTPGAPLLALTFSHASQTARLEISNGLPGDFSSSTRLLPENIWLIERTQPRTARAPSLRPHYKSLSATTSRSASASRDGTQPLTASAPLGDLPLARRACAPDSIGTRLLLFRAEAADRARVVYMPDTAWPVSGHPPGSSRGSQNTPVPMSSECVSTRQQRFACARLPGPHLTPLTTPFPHRSPRRSSANAA